MADGTVTVADRSVACSDLVEGLHLVVKALETAPLRRISEHRISGQTMPRTAVRTVMAAAPTFVQDDNCPSRPVRNGLACGERAFGAYLPAKKIPGRPIKLP